MSSPGPLSTEKKVARSDSFDRLTSPTGNSSVKEPVSDLVRQLRAYREAAKNESTKAEIKSEKIQSEQYWGPVKLPDLYPLLGAVEPTRILKEARRSLKAHFGVTNLDQRESIELRDCLQMALQSLIMDDRAAQSNRYTSPLPFRLLHPVADGIFLWIETRMPDWTNSPVPTLYLEQKFGEPKTLWDSFKERLFDARREWRERYVTVGPTYLITVPEI